ncbi:hypothetical protein RFI_36083, partial [Reticulomyxa filosa]
MKPTGIKSDIIPKEEDEFVIQFHCFMPLTMNNEKVINHFILFSYNTGLLIKYDEQNKTFNYEQLPICTDLKDFNMCSFAHIYDYIFLFGCTNSEWKRRRLVYKYSMKDKTWNQCKITLPMEIFSSFTILSNDDTSFNKIHVSVNVEELFEKSELLKMTKIYVRMIELKNEIMKMKLERPYIIPIEKQRRIEDEKENKE